MGLDIRVFSGVVKADEKTCRRVLSADYPYDVCFDEKLGLPSKHPSFPKHFEGLEEVPYSYQDSWGFRAGSYSGYSNWSTHLAILVGIERLSLFWSRCADNPALAEETPFGELLWFSDCEGSIGPVTCRKLAEDFGKWKEKAIEFSSYLRNSNLFYDWDELYSEWRQAFHDGSSGWVTFT